jgi:hypothetical protein
MLILVSRFNPSSFLFIYFLLLLDPELVRETRTSIPLYHQRRFDIYGDVNETVQFRDDDTGVKKE